MPKKTPIITDKSVLGTYYTFYGEYLISNYGEILKLNNYRELKISTRGKSNYTQLTIKGRQKSINVDKLLPTLFPANLLYGGFKSS